VTRAKRFPILAALVAALVGTLLVAIPGAGVAGPTAAGDVFMRDDVNDTGAEPNQEQHVWNSPDIELPFPLFGNTTLIRVRLNNKGDPITGDLQLFYTELGTAAKWWDDWNIIKVVSGITVPSGGRTVEVRWNNVPRPGYFCLLARWDSQDQDPMTFPEPYDSSTYTNVQNNNNLAWKNVNLVRFRFDRWYQQTIRIRNPEPEPRPFNLLLTQQPDRPFTRTGRLVLDLGPVLGSRWLQIGQPGVGVRPLGGTQVEIVNTGRAVVPGQAAIQNLMVYPDEQLDVSLGFWASASAGTPTGYPYPIGVIQTDTEGRNVGGVDLTTVVE
jgi:hypothetical protein